MQMMRALLVRLLRAIWNERMAKTNIHVHITIIAQETCTSLHYLLVSIKIVPCLSTYSEWEETTGFEAWQVISYHSEITIFTTDIEKCPPTSPWTFLNFVYSNYYIVDRSPKGEYCKYRLVDIEKQTSLMQYAIWLRK